MKISLGKELLDIIVKIQDSESRARMAKEIVKLKKAAVGDPITEAEEEVAAKISDWIDATWPEETVRARHARKVAGMIRAGKWKTRN